MKPITRREAFKRGGRFLLSAATCSLLPGFVTGCSQQELDQGRISEIMQQIKTADINDIRLTVVYDNVPYRKGLLTDGGCACRVEGLEKTILFDSGRCLVVSGQVDGARPGNSIDVTGVDLSGAVDALVSGSEIPTEQKPSMGCNIKWKPGNEPDYFAKV